MADKLHPIVKLAGCEFADGKLDRREFLRVATLLGIAAPVAFGMAGLPIPARAQGAPKKGGIVRLGSRVHDLKSPHTYSWVEAANGARQCLDYLTYTGVDNITRPNLVEKWDADQIALQNDYLQLVHTIIGDSVLKTVPTDLMRNDFAP